MTPLTSSSSIAVPPGACIRAAAVAAGSGVELSIVDASGVVLASDHDAAFAVVPSKGTLCPRGAIALRTKRLAGDGQVWVQAWTTAR
jgi:hypothetical protein